MIGVRVTIMVWSVSHTPDSAYFWPTLYLLVISVEMAYGKRIIKSVDLKTLSGPVLYTNLLGLTPMLMFAAMGGEYSKFVQTHMVMREPITWSVMLFMFLGCAAGTGIGYAGWWCRGQVSATTFTLVGVMNKCLTILLNLAIWDQHAKAGGIASLLLCLVGGTIYRQAPMRGAADSLPVSKEQPPDEENVKLLDSAGSDDEGTATKRKGKE